MLRFFLVKYPGEINGVQKKTQIPPVFTESHHYSLRGDTMVPSGLDARLCYAFIVSHVVIICAN